MIPSRPFFADSHLAPGRILQLDEAEALYVVYSDFVEFQLVFLIFEHEAQVVVAQVQHFAQLGTLVNVKRRHVYRGISHLDLNFVEMDQLKVLNRQV